MKSSDPDRRLLWVVPASVRAPTLALALLTVCGGCKLFAPTRPGPPTRSDRLMQAYPELRSGRFLVIADFEDPVQMGLFTLVGTSPEAKCVLDEKRGRTDTGKGCLQFTAGAQDDAIVVNNRGADNWYLKRDWRPYDLLLLSIHAPAVKRRASQRDWTLEVAIAGGSDAETVAVHSSTPLRRGWNVLRLDLAEVGERIPLDDVREIRLSVSGLDEPVDLRFDDILLTGDREDIFGDSSGRDGGLYAQRVGRHWKIGAGGRFELTFANGQVAKWYNLAADPHRLRNLIEGTILGPSPIVLGSTANEQSDFAELGQAVVVREEIVEISAVRAVVACDWWFVDDPDRALDDRPFQRWVYTIYPTGQLYAAVTCTAATQRWSPPRLGLAVTAAWTPDDACRIARPGEHDRSEDAARPPTYATLRSRQSDAFLLYVLGGSGKRTSMVERTDPQLRRVSFMAGAPRPDSNVETWNCHILLGGADDVSDEEALARAAEYARGLALRMEVGTLMDVGGEPAEVHGFDQAAGCHTIVPDRDVVRFVIGSRTQPCFSPAFKILSSNQKDVWVYVNDLILEKVARDRAGNVIFQLPGTLTKPTMVEVLLRRPAGV